MHVRKTVVIGGSQTLDRSIWELVIFSGVRLKYHGGPLVLDQVQFINCTYPPWGQIPVDNSGK